MGAYFASLNFASLPARMPSAIAQGILWGLMALGVYITFRLLDVADLSVDGSFATGGAVTVMLIISGWPAWAALLAALLVKPLNALLLGERCSSAYWPGSARGCCIQNSVSLPFSPVSSRSSRSIP